MTAAALLADLSGRGFALRADGDRVLIAPASELSPDDRTAIAAVRDDLHALLRGWDRDDPPHTLEEAAALFDAIPKDSRPMPAEQVRLWLAANQRRRGEPC